MAVIYIVQSSSILQRELGSVFLVWSLPDIINPEKTQLFARRIFLSEVWISFALHSYLNQSSRYF